MVMSYYGISKKPMPITVWLCQYIATKSFALKGFATNNPAFAQMSGVGNFRCAYWLS